MTNLKQLENNLLFGRVNKRPDDRLNSIAQGLYSLMQRSEAIYEEHRVIKYLKEPHLSQKIFTFVLILDVHVLVRFYDNLVD